MRIGPNKLGLYAKVAFLGACSVVFTAATLVALAMWQSHHYNKLAHGEVEQLINADLDHLTMGVYHLVQTENEAVQQQVDGNLKVARHVLQQAGGADLAEEIADWTAVNQYTGEAVPVRLSKMRIGGKELVPNPDPAVETPVVDHVARLVGETATIFQRMNEAGDMLRVATTVLDEQGRRAIGTYIPARDPDGTPNPVVAAVMKGETYRGRAYVVNAWHLTAYEPIRGAGGELMGMLYVGIRQKTVEARIRQAIVQTRVGRTGYVYVLGGKGEDRGRYIISQGGRRDGEDIWNQQDHDGNYMIRSIIGKAMALQPGEMATERYRWQNPEDEGPHWKVARLAYYAPWDWVIGVGVREDELQSYQTILSDGRNRMMLAMGLAGLVIALLAGVASLYMAWSITGPVRQITKAAERIIRGDLDHAVEVQTRDEVGTLAKTFNYMVGQLKQTLEGLQKSEEKYRYIFENSIEGIFQTTVEGRFLSASPAMARLLGYESTAELIDGVTDLQKQLYVHPKERAEVLAAVTASSGSVEREIQLCRKDGRIIWGLLNLRAVRDPEGRVRFIQGFLTEITSRKQAEAELLKLAAVVQHCSEMVSLAGLDGRMIYLNDAGRQMLGIEVGAVAGMPILEVIAEPWREKAAHEILPAMASGGWEGELEYRNHKTGEQIPVHATVFLVSDPDTGAPLYYANVSLDITGLKLAERELKRFRFMVENAKQEIYLVDPEGRLGYVNQAAADSLGYTVDEMLAGGVALFDPAYGPAYHAHYLDLKKRDLPPFETIHVAKDGRRIVKEMKAMYLPIEGKEYVCGFGFDITERKRAQEELQRISRMQSVILNNSTVGIALVRNRVFEWVNPRMLEVFGLTLDQCQGAPTRIVYPDEESYRKVSAMYPQLEQGEKATLEMELARGDGTRFWCRMEGKAVEPGHPEEGVIWIAEDFTARKRAEEALARRIVSLTRPLDAGGGVALDDLFDVQDLQRIQEEFAAATGVASVITRPDGTPITEPSRFCRLCKDIIRRTEKGRQNCYKSDAVLGRRCDEGPIVQPCLSGGLWDAGASIHVGGQHVANWLIGQVRDRTQTEENMREYAREIGVGEDEFMEAFREVPSMSRAQFERIAQLLFTFANQLSAMAYQNVQQARFIADLQRAEEQLRRHRDHLEKMVQEWRGENNTAG